MCGDGWNKKGGNVVCAQLGCGTALLAVSKTGMFDLGFGPIYLSKVNCSGTEKNLWQCLNKPDEGRNFCGHKEDAEVVCSGTDQEYLQNTNSQLLVYKYLLICRW